MKFVLIIPIFAATVFADPVVRPQGCEEIQNVARNKGQNATSGVYKVYPPVDNTIFSNGVEVFCDMETDGGGWIVIQRRRETESPQTNFYRNWVEYTNGFGVLLDSFWIGLELISELTHPGNLQLRVDLMDWEGEERYAEYAFFQVANSTDNYRLSVSGFSGSAGDSLALQNGMRFSTKDLDNDNYSGSCAQARQGGYWYEACTNSNLNGVYGNFDLSGITWYGWHGNNYSMKRVEMKIRRVEDDVVSITLPKFD